MSRFAWCVWLLALAACSSNPTATTSSGSSGSSGASATGASSSGGSSTGATSADSTGSTGSGGGIGGSTGGQTTLFPPDAPWYQDVSGVLPASESSAIITDLASNGGWGNGNVFQIDFSLTLLHADATTEFISTWTQTSNWYSPDCDAEPMPLPQNGAVEGASDYACPGNSDCHLLVIDDAHQKLYEMWEANLVGPGDLEGGCQVVWDLSRHYPDNLRGDGCTSADAAGFPISALLFTADEVAAGHIDHAIRFILPNARIRSGAYVHPSTHTTGAASGGPNAPPYGVRLRLRGDYPIDTLPSEGAKVVARALQKYGMFLSDGGQIALTAADDRFTTAKWSGLLGSHDLQALTVNDFEVVNLPTPTPTQDCTRNP